MPPKSKKRRITASSNATSSTRNASPALPPDRATWPGWVEMESEPAFFNVMLREMGVSGVKVQEVYGLDDDSLAVLPQPVHALIFLFRYRTGDPNNNNNSAIECPKEVWFANQVPDHACASVALLNIVNNLSDVGLGPELHDFKELTSGMDPMTRGECIDTFDFVKRIHNSFAREADMLNADLLMSNKAAKYHRRIKAAETRAANGLQAETVQANTSKKRDQLDGVSSTPPPRTSGRVKKPSTILENLSVESKPTSSAKNNSDSSHLGDDEDFNTAIKLSEQEAGLRRSDRKPIPRKAAFPSITNDNDDSEEGFHFIAFIPIANHVWKLDGLENFPQDMGVSISGLDWMEIARPALVGRIAEYTEGEVEFNLMSVVTDPIVQGRMELSENIKLLQLIGKRLDEVSNEWREYEGGETSKCTIVGPDEICGITDELIDKARPTPQKLDRFQEEDCPMKLMQLRQEFITQQASLRAAVRDELESAKLDDERARHRRHNYGSFVRGWLGALAEQEQLTELMEDQ